MEAFLKITYREGPEPQAPSGFERHTYHRAHPLSLQPLWGWALFVPEKGREEKRYSHGRRSVRRVDEAGTMAYIIREFCASFSV